MQYIIIREQIVNPWILITASDHVRLFIGLFGGFFYLVVFVYWTIFFVSAMNIITHTRYIKQLNVEKLLVPYTLKWDKYK